MGMLLTHHDGYRPEAEKPAEDETPKRRKAAKGKSED